MARPRLLDLCCKAGGASMGYYRAGFDVTGVDIEPQPNYPFHFILGDALTVPLDGYDVIAASPPCQAHTSLRSLHPGKDYPDIIPRVRARLIASGALWAIENVPGAPLIDPVMLCGSSFGLRVRRHRLFESNVFMMQMPCRHRIQGTPLGVYGHGGGGQCKRGLKATRAQAIEAMDIDWMTRAELSQAIPPAFTEYIGMHLMAALQWKERTA